jgi:hypothetical protein
MKQKSFDCIKMKRDIHQKMLHELQGLSCEERLARFERDIKSNPILLKVWQKHKRKDPKSVDKESLLVR